ncbi:UNVERIFIED_CONTAM: protein, chloroplastic [Sesamum angustifolium]|uniref:Protein TIC 40, chloroplastic n=1 Tax=Sesamum angustifolium TaxID=2727405 RepID=A0AAW2IMM6_9LAMI
MENLGLVSSPKIVLGVSSKPRDSISSTPFVGLPNLLKKPAKHGRPRNSTSSFTVVSLFNAPNATKTIVPEKVARDSFASIASRGQETSSVGANPQLSVPPPPSHVGSPLFWIGVGVGLSALFSWVAGRAKKYAMEQAFKTFTQQMNTQNNPFGNASFSPGSPFPFPPAATPASDSSRTSTPVASQRATVDVPATKVEDPPSISVKDRVEPEKEPKKIAFVDVSPDETLQKNEFENYKESIHAETPNDPKSSQPVSQNGTATKQGTGASEGPPPMCSLALPSMISVLLLGSFIVDSNGLYTTGMLQNPQYRQQLQDMLNNMGGSPEWDNRMMESLKNFDLSSPEIKQQFDQIGLSPEEVISKIMANPDVAMAFQNPRVQAAIMDCSQNPLSIAKYQNDKEVMDVFNKISELFPGVNGDLLRERTISLSAFMYLNTTYPSLSTLLKALVLVSENGVIASSCQLLAPPRYTAAQHQRHCSSSPGLLGKFQEMTGDSGEPITRVLFCGLQFPASHNYTKEYLQSHPCIKVDVIPLDDVPHAIGNYDICVVKSMRLSPDIIARANKMKLIMQFGVGLEGVDINAATKHGIKVARIPGDATGNAASCAEMAIYQMLGLLRKQYEMQVAVRQKKLGEPVGETLLGKTIFILGYGNIGIHLAKRLQPFGVRILATKRSWPSSSQSSCKSDVSYSENGTHDDLVDEKGGHQDILKFARRADIVVCCLAMNSETAGIVDKDFISSMRKGALLINIARGGLLDYEAVLHHLKSGHLGGLGIDVAWTEPFDPDDAILKFPNVIITSCCWSY